MTDDWRGPRPPRSTRNQLHLNSSSRRQRRRHRRGSSTEPPIEGDSAGSTGSGTYLGESVTDNPTYAQSSADMMEISTYRNDIPPTDERQNATVAHPVIYTYAAGHPNSSPLASHERNNAGAAAYNTPISGTYGTCSSLGSYGPHIPLSSSAVNFMAVGADSNERLTPYPTAMNVYPTAIPTTVSTASNFQSGAYTQPDPSFPSYSSSIALSPVSEEVSDDDTDTYVRENTFDQSQASYAQVSPSLYDSSGRRWSTENHQGSIVGSPGRQTMPETQSREEQDPAVHEQLERDNIRRYVDGEEPWNSQKRRNKGRHAIR